MGKTIAEKILSHKSGTDAKAGDIVTADIDVALSQDVNGPHSIDFFLDLETENVIDNAKNKLIRKNLDMIVANDVSTSAADTVDIGFNSEYNALHVYWAQNNHISGEQYFDIARKSQLAKQLITLIAKQFKRKQSQHAKNTA